MINHKQKDLKKRIDQLETYVHNAMWNLQTHCKDWGEEEMPMWHLLPLKSSVDALIRHHRDNDPKVSKKVIAKSHLDLETMK